MANIFMDTLRQVGAIANENSNLLKQKYSGIIDPLMFDINRQAQQFQQQYGVYDYDPETNRYVINLQKQDEVINKLLPLVMAFSGGIKAKHPVTNLPFKLGRLKPETYKPPGQIPYEVWSNLGEKISKVRKK